mmetsp:Transcript_23078/g.38144  ORF Transcript_23078/g.38144 Transcript_23078/m.38144 type:complete len:179 (-) Transcript_23078:55-591(-)|eukprot:CAMPEP_0119031234 /NCGR_PEP_ID=MMETSP1176-20130426/41442_1 /TAXON_ID=265551 /ORGANISM="Synedropsis recta cf, Strain CCMP1620" /LENGTH=178 /DNA_ID=CAMNT_0006987625 /DNA_START=32 /DNA_END=568 /DNA_ORIENTATION=+
MSSPPKKLLDYTQRGKSLDKDSRTHFKQCGSSQSACLSEPTACSSSSITSSISSTSPTTTTRAARARPQKGSGTSSRMNIDSTLEFTLDLLIHATKTLQQSASDDDNDDGPIDFMLRIPSSVDRRREQRSDLRERFSKRRSISNSHCVSTLIESMSSDTNSSPRRRILGRSPAQRASF